MLLTAPPRRSRPLLALLSMPCACALFAVALAASGSDTESDVEGAVASPRARLAAVGLVTGRFEEMLGFYRDTLGFVVAQHDPEGPFVEFENEGSRFQLLARETMASASGYDGYGVERRGYAFGLAFEVATPELVDTLFAEIVAAGGTPIAAPADMPWGQRVAFFADPDGNIHDVYCGL